MRKIIVYIAMSLDGYIARHDDDIGFLSQVEEPGQDYGYAQFIEKVDTVIMGRKTYDKVLSFGIPFPHSEKKTYVLTRSSREPEGNIEFYDGDIAGLINTLKSAEGMHVFVDGGARVIAEMMREDLIDEYYISVIPYLLGEGIRLFADGRPEQYLKLLQSMQYSTGLVQLHYERNK